MDFSRNAKKPFTLGLYFIITLSEYNKDGSVVKYYLGLSSLQPFRRESKGQLDLIYICLVVIHFRESFLFILKK